MEVCNFLVSWIGNCKEIKPCPKHSQIKCSVCGAQAMLDGIASVAKARGLKEE